jgi:hypothetical protein
VLAVALLCQVNIEPFGVFEAVTELKFPVVAGQISGIREVFNTGIVVH